MVVGPLAPDLARGAMLLIALAHAHLYLYGAPTSVRRYQVPEAVPSK